MVRFRSVSSVVYAPALMQDIPGTIPSTVSDVSSMLRRLHG